MVIDFIFAGLTVFRRGYGYIPQCIGRKANGPLISLSSDIGACNMHEKLEIFLEYCIVIVIVKAILVSLPQIMGIGLWLSMFGAEAGAWIFLVAGVLWIAREFL